MPLPRISASTYCRVCTNRFSWGRGVSAVVKARDLRYSPASPAEDDE